MKLGLEGDVQADDRGRTSNSKQQECCDVTERALDLKLDNPEIKSQPCHLFTSCVT